MKMARDTQSDPTQVIVPVHLAAYCVGTVDAHEATPSFAGASTDFRDPATPATGGFIGANVDRGLDVAPLNKLDAGVHLHWALPKAMTQGTVDGDTLGFPAAPNRWLVTRLHIDDDTPTARHWVVTSDKLNEAPPTGQVAVTLPVKNSDGTMGCRYVGQNGPLEDHDETLFAQETELFAAVTGGPLTAVATGTPSFASFYPDCSSVFGFFDDVSDIQSPQNINLTYVVTGWYSDPGHDIAATADTIETLKSVHGLALDDDAPPPSVSICHGVAQSIQWNPNTQYIKGQQDQGPVKADLALANTSAEAMSAYYNGKMKPGTELFELLLTALQYGQLDQFAAPKPDQLAALRDTLFAGQFASADSGTVYRITPKPKDPGAPPGGQVTLPTALADDLNALNLAQEQVDRSAAYLETYKWELFADWYRIFKAGDNVTRNAAYQIAAQRYGGWDDLEQDHAKLVSVQQAALKKVQDALPSDMCLNTAPAERYYQPAEPSVLLSLGETPIMDRAVGTRQETGISQTGCRTPDQIITALTISGTEIDASRFQGATTSIGDQVPYGATCSALIEEACLLNSTLGAAISGQAAQAVETSLEDVLSGTQQSLITDIKGTPPESLCIGWWAENPWMPLFLSYTVSFQPIWETIQSNKPTDYPTDFFNTTFTIDPAKADYVDYTPGGSPIDPAKAAYGQTYKGAAILSTSAPAQFATQLAEFTKRHPDRTLSAIETDLNDNTILVQPLSGIAQSLLMREQTLQLPVSAEKGSPYADLTQAIAPIVGQAVTVSPAFNGFFNPLRAGWMKLKLELVDIYGAKRTVDVGDTFTAASMTAANAQGPVPSVAYMPPRLAQLSRLMFRWVSADKAELEESNALPATTPICGWIMTDHLEVGFFLYSQDGLPIGQLFLNGDATKIMWQAAPGNDATINETIDETLQDANPVFRDFALALANGSIDYFKAFWKAVDSAYGAVTSARNPGAGYAWLIGRPIAIAQADLRFDLGGMEALNQSFDTIDSNGNYDQTGNGITEMELPVELGSLDQLDDGLIGYFLPKAGGGTDYATFYCEAAGGNGVTAPEQDTLTLTATPKVDGNSPPDLTGGATRVVMLVEPHAPVHATTGIVPTQKLELPPDLVADVLSNIELWFRAAPVLRGESMLIPTPKIQGFDCSFVEGFKTADGTAYWSVDSQLQTPTGGAVWGYSPQTINEGWLRFNQQNLLFTLANADGKQILAGGAPNNSLTLTVTNAKPGDMTFVPSDTPLEGQAPSGSVLYIHLGAAVAAGDVAKASFSADGWTFKPLNDAQHGHYWAATPSSANVELKAQQTLTIKVDNLIVQNGITRSSLGYDYFNVTGTSDGVFTQTITIQPKSK